jgi:Ca-activated chloride channel homolog
MLDFNEILSSGQLVFGQSWAFWLLPLPLLIMLLPALKYRAESLYTPYFSDVIDLKKEKPSPGVRIARRNWMQMILMFLVWASLIIALAAPQLIGEPEKQIKTARNLLLNIDLSLSMETRDWTSKEGKRTSRWEAVKEVMSEFIERREGDRMGLILFASQAYLQTPFTDDLDVVEGLLNESEIGMAGAKTAMGNSIGKAVELFQTDSIEKKVMILVSDGEDSGSELNPIQAARLAAIDSILIYTIGIGTTSGSVYELDEKTLTAIAEATGGRYFRASDRESLEQVYAELDKLEPIEYENEDYIPRRLLFYYPLILALGLALSYHVLAGFISSLRFIYFELKGDG